MSIDSRLQCDFIEKRERKKPMINSKKNGFYRFKIRVHTVHSDEISIDDCGVSWFVGGCTVDEIG